MSGSKRFLMMLILLLGLAVTVSAQDKSNGTLTSGQPSSMQMVSGEIFQFNYVLSQTSRVTLQAISGSAQPTISIQHDGLQITSESNPNGQFNVELTAVLNGGNYVVEVTGANNSSGLVILSVQSETPLTVVPLQLGVSAQGEITQADPVMVFEFGGLTETAFLFIDTFLPDRGVDVNIVNLATGAITGGSDPEVLGTRFQFSGSGAFYQLQIGGGTTRPGTPFTVCLTLVRVGGCTGSSSPQPTAQPTEATGTVDAPVATEEVVAAGCTVSPNASGGVNIRQSATTGSIVIGALPTGQSAAVLGIAPNGTFFNIQFNSINGWVAVSVVTTSGDCANLPTVQPPAVISPPTATPVPTHTPVPPQPTASGPCLLTINSPTFLYTTTIEQVDYLYDQVQSGELIPIGRTSDNQWWQVNYANSWLPRHSIGETVTRSGNCSGLPTVSP